MATYDGNQGQPASIVTGDIINFTFSGSVKSITLPKGTYKLEVYGARGGQYKGASNAGGYSYGEYNVTSDNQILYICVGGRGYIQGNYDLRGYNGGGKTSTMSYYNCGGGATHIALSTGLLKNVPKTDVIIVAGGSGGSYVNEDHGLLLGGNGGGTNGGNARSVYSGIYSNGGSQTAGGTSYNYGSGSYGQGAATGSYSIGGGGGWYGGGGGYSQYQSAGGGSGYLNPILNNSSMVNGGASDYEDGYVKITVLKVVTAPPIFVNVGGSWKSATQVSVNIGGTWKNVTEIKSNINGTYHS